MRILLPSVRRRARIEIIPLIDIMFFLLATFVMVSLSMIKNQGVSVRLPSAVSSQPQDRKSSVIVTVTEKNEIYLNKEVVLMPDLKGRLKTMKDTEPELKVFINGDDGADFGRAVEVLDEVRSLGITKVAIQTKTRK